MCLEFWIEFHFGRDDFQDIGKCDNLPEIILEFLFSPHRPRNVRDKNHLLTPTKYWCLSLENYGLNHFHSSGIEHRINLLLLAIKI